MDQTGSIRTLSDYLPDGNQFIFIKLQDVRMGKRFKNSSLAVATGPEVNVAKAFGSCRGCGK